MGWGGTVERLRNMATFGTFPMFMNYRTNRLSVNVLDLESSPVVLNVNPIPHSVQFMVEFRVKTGVSAQKMTSLK